MVQIIGIDPGLVDTGLVYFEFYPQNKQYRIQHHVVENLDFNEIEDWCKNRPVNSIFIEAYRPRSHFQNDARMGTAINELKHRLPKAVTLDNTGVKKVIKPDLMKLLGVWQFKTSTHHQDLRAAARIGLYGLVKNVEWNPILAQLVMDHLDGKPWVRQ